MSKLVWLEASGKLCAINDEGIQNINLKKLNTYNNPKITNVNNITSICDNINYVLKETEFFSYDFRIYDTKW
jgi:hypothetical protein